MWLHMCETKAKIRTNVNKYNVTLLLHMRVDTYID